MWGIINKQEPPAKHSYKKWGNTKKGFSAKWFPTGTTTHPLVTCYWTVVVLVKKSTVARLRLREKSSLLGV